MRNIINRNFYVIFFLDALFTVLSFYLAYAIRFEFNIPEQEYSHYLSTIPFIISVKLGTFLLFNLYRGMWRYTSIVDIINVAEAVFASSLFIVFGILMFQQFQGYSRSVFIIDMFLTFLLVVGIRISIRLYYNNKIDTDMSSDRLKKHKKKILIIGADRAGEKVCRELMDNHSLYYQVIGFLDDDPLKKGKTVHGFSVLGEIESLCKVVCKHSIEEVFITIPSASGKQIRQIVELCKSTDIKFKILPGIDELINGKISIKELRDVDYQDLLGRKPVSLGINDIKGYLDDKTVLVTGAGGSIGSELCRQIARFNPARMILLDASEESLYNIEMEFKYKICYQRTVSILGGVQNLSLLNNVFNKYKPQVVFHAAAYKHVPLMELNPWQAVHNNIMGTQRLLEQSLKNNVDIFVFVSTDKSVRPTNIMGASKRICELLLHGYQNGKTKTMSVRFGNVLGSSGSVIPLFRKQIANGGPVTVTHPEVTRYFMTINEASQLILQAGALGVGGEIFILEMGTPVKIADMAHDLIRLSGKEPETDIEISYTGLRPGEKLYEELIIEGEGIVPTNHERIMVLHPNGNWNGHGSQKNYLKWLISGVEDLIKFADSHDEQMIRAKLQELVPEYKPQMHVN